MLQSLAELTKLNSNDGADSGDGIDVALITLLDECSDGVSHDLAQTCAHNRRCL